VLLTFETALVMHMMQAASF